MMQEERVNASAMLVNDPSRFWGAYYTTVFAIQTMCPFSFAERQCVRMWMKAMNPSDDFDPAHLHHKNVRHYVVEIYKALEGKMKSELGPVLKRTLPGFSLQVDLWTSQPSGQKYLGGCLSYVSLCSRKSDSPLEHGSRLEKAKPSDISLMREGVRVSWIGSDYRMHSALLAIKRYRPSSRLKEKGADAIKIWLDQVLEQFGLKNGDEPLPIVCSVTDAGSDIKRLCNVLLKPAVREVHPMLCLSAHSNVWSKHSLDP